MEAISIDFDSTSKKMKAPIVINYNVRGPQNARQAIITPEQLDQIREELQRSDAAWDALLDFDRRRKTGPANARVAEYATEIEPVLSKILDRYVHDPSLVFWQVLFALIEDENQKP